MSAFTALVPALRRRSRNTNTGPTNTRPTRPTNTRRTNTYRGRRR